MQHIRYHRPYVSSSSSHGCSFHLNSLCADYIQVKFMYYSIMVIATKRKKQAREYNVKTNQTKKTKRES